jgi:hypothetical protein
VLFLTLQEAPAIQLLTRFIEEDMAKDDASRCAFLSKYLRIDLPQFDYKVPVAKDSTKLNNKGQFDYDDEEYDFGKWKVNGQLRPRMIDSVGM